MHVKQSNSIMDIKRVFTYVSINCVWVLPIAVIMGAR